VLHIVVNKLLKLDTVLDHEFTWSEIPVSTQISQIVQ